MKKKNKKPFKDYERAKKGNARFGRMRPSVQKSTKDKMGSRNVMKANLRKRLKDDGF